MEGIIPPLVLKLRDGPCMIKVATIHPVGLARPILEAKVVRGDQFFCQNRSSRTDFGVTIQ